MCQPLTTQFINKHMEHYYNRLLEHLDGYTVQGIFQGKRNINDIVTLQEGTLGRVFFFDQEPMSVKLDQELWDYIFQEPTIFANSELDSEDKKYLQEHYPNFIDWYYFSNAMLSLEWFDPHKYNYAGWWDHKQTLLDCNLITGSRQYRVYLIHHMYHRGFNNNSFLSFNGDWNWKKDLEENDQFNLLGHETFDRIPTEKISYDNWGKDHSLYNGMMQSRIPLDYYSRVNYIFVSETLCVENKKHLSDKVFKPIVAGKPFVLAAGVNNLEYLKSYGFQTFDSLWDESYDKIHDPKTRLDALFNVVDYEINLGEEYLSDFDITKSYRSQEEKLDIFDRAHNIARKNREWFWSKEFENKLFAEAFENLEIAKKTLESMNI